MTSRLDIFVSLSMTTIADVSFQAPKKKKATLKIDTDRIEGLLQDESPLLSIDSKDVTHVVSMPKPETTSKTTLFCLIPTNATDSVIFSVPDTRANDVITALEAIHLSCASATQSIVSRSSANGPIYNVAATRGPKPGNLYFLDTGIFYGFTKPVLFYPLASISQVAFTSILRTTFDLVIDSTVFSMIGVEWSDAVGAYVKRHKLNDTSMGEERRAKRQKVKDDGDEDKEEGQGELRKAYAELKASGKLDEESEEEAEEEEEENEQGSVSDDEEDENFDDEESHGGSTSESDEEAEA